MKNKRDSVHYVNLKQAIQKLETELRFLKDVNIRERPFSLRSDISRLQQRVCTQKKTKSNRQNCILTEPLLTDTSYKLTCNVMYELLCK